MLELKVSANSFGELKQKVLEIQLELTLGDTITNQPEVAVESPKSVAGTVEAASVGSAIVQPPKRTRRTKAEIEATKNPTVTESASINREEIEGPLETPTEDSCRALLKEVMALDNGTLQYEAAKKLLRDFSVAKVSELNSSQYADFTKEAQKVLGA